MLLNILGGLEMAGCFSSQLQTECCTSNLHKNVCEARNAHNREPLVSGCSSDRPYMHSYFNRFLFVILMSPHSSVRTNFFEIDLYSYFMFFRRFCPIDAKQMSAVIEVKFLPQCVP